jgi:hypothetical protein
MGNGNPDLAGKLRADAVYAKGREQADDRPGHARAHRGDGVVLGGLGVGQAVQAPGHALDESLFGQAAQIRRAQPEGCRIASPEEGSGSHLTQALDAQGRPPGAVGSIGCAAVLGHHRKHT